MNFMVGQLTKPLNQTLRMDAKTAVGPGLVRKFMTCCLIETSKVIHCRRDMRTIYIFTSRDGIHIGIYQAVLDT